MKHKGKIILGYFLGIVAFTFFAHHVGNWVRYKVSPIDIVVTKEGPLPISEVEKPKGSREYFREYEIRITKKSKSFPFIDLKKDTLSVQAKSRSRI